MIKRHYQQSVATKRWVSDAAQAQAIDKLQRLLDSVNQQVATSGLYLWGPVGRGKTALMDQFYLHCRVRKKRQHFHHFMRWLHQEMHRRTGQADPLTHIAFDLADEIDVLCFDEMFVSDIADAMILGRFWSTLFNRGVTLVITSNQAPQHLYPNGFNREQFLPAIASMLAHMDVVHLDGGQDHRLHQHLNEPRYFLLPTEQAHFDALFAQGESDEGDVAQPILYLGGRAIPCMKQRARWFLLGFDDLCRAPLSALDFVELAAQCDRLFLCGVPRLARKNTMRGITRGTEDAAQLVRAGERQLPELSKNDDAVRRFIALIDECYEQRIGVVIGADVVLDELYTEGYLHFSFQRTLSRLREMQRLSFGRTSEN